MASARADAGFGTDSATSIRPTALASLASLSNAISDYFHRASDLTEAVFGDTTEAVNARKVLGLMIGTKSTISTSSDFALENEYASIDPDAAIFQFMGKGMCGTVWRLQGTDQVYKIANLDKDASRLHNDRYMHRLVEEAFAESPFEMRQFISIPKQRCWLAPSDTEQWDDLQEKFPAHYQNFPRYALVSQVIMPVPLPLRGAIIDGLLPSHFRANKGQILSADNNQNCLIRVYLGRREPDSRKNLREVKLNNFPFLVNDLEQLNVNTVRLAGIMADSLAIMHWKASVDANDVEFVFGSSPRWHETLSAAEIARAGPDSSEGAKPAMDFTRRSLQMWLLDFNECKKFEKNAAGLDQIVRGFWFNDPYYPRPTSEHTNDVELWAVFRDRYLASSSKLTDSALPGQFIMEVEKRGQERLDSVKRSELNSLLGQLTM